MCQHYVQQISLLYFKYVLCEEATLLLYLETFYSYLEACTSARVIDAVTSVGGTVPVCNVQTVLLSFASCEIKNKHIQTGM